MDVPLPQIPLPSRLGPRPLPLHLATEGWLLQMSFAGLMPAWGQSNSGSPLSKPIRRLAAEHAHQNPDTFTQDWRESLDAVAFVDALTREAKARMDRLLEGVTRYQTHSFKRTRTAPTPVWTYGAASLRDYGGPEHAPAVVFVPSLVNRAYILDLAADRSLLAATAKAGLRTFLLDWGEPGETERTFGMEDYVTRVMIPALEHVAALTKTKPRLAGYCMGGTLTAALAVLRPDLISGLALLAAPWDFHADSAASRQFLSTFRPMIDGMIAAQGCASVDFLQAMFASLDPTLVGRKFRGFAARDMNTEAAQRFVELEDWLNDGVPLVAEVARQCLFGWYGDNQTLKGAWSVGGQVIDPSKIAGPTLAVIPSHDRIVPPDSAKALAARIPGCKKMIIELGHIGMMAGSSAPELLYAPLAKWLKELG
jgi:polyhydroxyalkanoate synthase subunit PhaC